MNKLGIFAVATVSLSLLGVALPAGQAVSQ